MGDSKDKEGVKEASSVVASIAFFQGRMEKTRGEGAKKLTCVYVINDLLTFPLLRQHKLKSMFVSDDEISNMTHCGSTFLKLTIGLVVGKQNQNKTTESLCKKQNETLAWTLRTQDLPVGSWC